MDYSASFRDLTAVPDEVAAMQSLRRLDLDGNHIESLPALPSTLRELLLDGNRLTTLPILPQLEKLHIRRNKLASIPDAVGDMRALRDLRIGGNALTSVPASIAKLTSLTMLDLSENALVAVPDLSALEQLEILDLGHNALTSIPKLNAPLDVLYIHDNQLAVFPDSLPPSIRYLNASENPFGSIPESIASITNLRELHLSDNRLTDLPPLPNVNTLNLRNNQLRTIPDAIRAMTNLRHLDLRGNRLLHLPDWIGDLNLEKLDLRWNKLASVPRVARDCFVLY